MTLEEARTIFRDMKSINPLILELYKRFELGQPESGSKNLIKDDESGRTKKTGVADGGRPLH